MEIKDTKYGHKNTISHEYAESRSLFFLNFRTYNVLVVFLNIDFSRTFPKWLSLSLSFILYFFNSPLFGG